MLEQFQWTSTAGVTITVPRMDSVKGGVIRSTRKLDPEDRGWTMLESVASKEALAQVDDLPSGEVNTFLEKWAETLGESTRSST